MTTRIYFKFKKFLTIIFFYFTKHGKVKIEGKMGEKVRNSAFENG